MMATAFFYFGKMINSDTSMQAIHACRSRMGELDQNQKQKWDTFKIAISSGGGDLISAFGMYNELRTIPQKLETHNSGAVDSSAILPFMIGSRRTASPHSAFLFHQTTWTFSSTTTTLTVIKDAARWLETYEGMMADIVSQNTKMSRDDVLAKMKAGDLHP